MSTKRKRKPPAIRTHGRRWVGTNRGYCGICKRRTTLIDEYKAYVAEHQAFAYGDCPSPRVVAGFCLQHPAPLQILDNLKLPFRANADDARALVIDAMHGEIIDEQ